MAAPGACVASTPMRCRSQSFTHHGEASGAEPPAAMEPEDAARSRHPHPALLLVHLDSVHMPPPRSPTAFQVVPYRDPQGFFTDGSARKHAQQQHDASASAPVAASSATAPTPANVDAPVSHFIREPPIPVVVAWNDLRAATGTAVVGCINVPGLMVSAPGHALATYAREVDAGMGRSVALIRAGEKAGIHTIEVVAHAAESVSNAVGAGLNLGGTAVGHALAVGLGLTFFAMLGTMRLLAKIVPSDG